MQIKFKWPDSVPVDHVDVQFIQGMLDRMAVGYHNYGHSRRSDEATKQDSLACLRKRLTKYRETGNTEWLMDAANFAMMEFISPRHKKAHFKSTTKSESPGAVLLDKRVVKGKEDM